MYGFLLPEFNCGIIFLMMCLEGVKLSVKFMLSKLVCSLDVGNLFAYESLC